MLSCGYGHTAVIMGGALYAWGIPDYGVLGHGPRSTTNRKLISGLGVSLPEDQEVDNLFFFILNPVMLIFISYLVISMKYKDDHSGTS